MAQTVDDEILSKTLIASVLDELDRVDSQARPPADEYAAILDSPPAYDVFGEAYAPWRAADEAKLAILAALDADPGFATAEKELRTAMQALKEMKEKSLQSFEALHTKKRRSFASLFSSKSKQKASQEVLTRVDSAPVVESFDIKDGGEKNGDIAQLDIKRSMSLTTELTDSNQLAAEEFRRAHEAEANQDVVVKTLEKKIAEFKRLKAALAKATFTVNLAWMHLRRIADETLSTQSELAIGLGELLERLEDAENVYSVANKMKADFSRACLAVQNSHVYFTRSLKISDAVRDTKTSRALLGSLGGAQNELSTVLEYRETVALAGKAQICLNEVFRVIDRHEHLISEDRMEDYNALKKIGVMQMSKIYNLIYGSSSHHSGISGSIKVIRERQESAFAHLTHLAVWIQDYGPVCMAEEEKASRLRDGVRREVAAFWEVNINRSGQ